MGKGRVTIPTDLDVVPQTLEMIEEWGADAIRDCDGTEFPQELKDTGAKIYATYYTTRKDNAWAKAHPEEIQQMYYDIVSYSSCRYAGNPPDGSPLSGYACSQYTR